MFEFEDSDLIKQKALILKTLGGLKTPLERLSKICTKIALKINELDEEAGETQDLKKIAVYSKESEKLRQGLIKFLAINDRIKQIKKRNEDRLNHINKELEIAGIYEERVNKSDLASLENKNLNEISESKLNLNCFENQTYKFFENERWHFSGAKLNLSENENREKVILLDEKTLHRLVSVYPESVSTIDADMLLNTPFKQRVLKEITSFVTEKSKTKNMKDINKMLGNLLSFKSEIPESVDSYVAGVQNLFSVMIKQHLKNQYPDFVEEIELELKCNEKSGLLPSSLKKAALDAKKQNETARNEVVEEEQNQSAHEELEMSVDDILNMLMNDDNTEPK